MRRTLLPVLGLEDGRDEVWDRAEACLRASLPPDDYAAYRKRGYVEVASRLTPGRTYRVDGWRPVAVYEQERFVGAVCLRPREALPGPDIVLARKLYIEGAESDFLRAGNWLSPAWRPAGVVPALVLVGVFFFSCVAQLGRFGPGGLAAGLVLLALAAMIASGRRISPASGRARVSSERPA